MAAVSDDQPEIKDVIDGEESEKWKARMEEELTQIEKLATWSIIEAPPGANIVPSKWTLHRKRNAQGEILRYWVRIVAKGYVQIFGKDFTETFAPTIHPVTLQILLVLAASKGHKIIIEQADAKNTYLNAFLNKDKIIYLALPPYYKLFCTIPTKLANSNKRIVLCLHCPLYGMKQGTHHWYQKLKQILMSLRFWVLQANKATFYHVKGKKLVIIAAATDDFTIIADSHESSNRIKKEMSEFFKLVDLGSINWLLGVSVVWDIENWTIALSQKSYINQILTEFHLNKARTTLLWNPESTSHQTLHQSYPTSSHCQRKPFIKRWFDHSCTCQQWGNQTSPMLSRHYPNVWTHPILPTSTQLKKYSNTSLGPNTSI